MNAQVKSVIELALAEDIASGDITTNAVFSGNETATAEYIAKEDGVIAGLELAGWIYNFVDSEIQFVSEISDGDFVRRGQLLATASGSAQSLLSSERVILNFMQRMSGVATKTRAYADELADFHTKILDTRKTIPGHRYLDKWAVRLGGGENHRFCLDDRFLIKENHIVVAGNIERAIFLCQEYKTKHNLTAKIEIEVKNLDEVRQVIDVGGVDYVMLDNMNLLDMQSAVRLINGAFLVEASGNVTLENLRDIAETGVDFISSGALTHSVKAFDISLLFMQ